MIYLGFHLDGVAFILEALHLLKITNLKLIFNRNLTYGKTLLLRLELDNLAETAWSPAFILQIFLVFYDARVFFAAKISVIKHFDVFVLEVRNVGVRQILEGSSAILWDILILSSHSFSM